MTYMYQYIVPLVLQYSDVLHDTVQCVLVSFGNQSLYHYCITFLMYHDTMTYQYIDCNKN